MKTQDRADIAHIVRSLDVIVPGAGLVIVRAVVGQQVLQAHGVRSRIVCGSLMYRGGPSEDDDVCLFGGPCNEAIFFEDGGVSGHFWLETADDLIDFSPGDWPAEWNLLVAEGVPQINWTVLPPDYWWRPREEFATPADLYTRDRVPPLGRAWYRAADCSGEEVLRGSETLAAAGAATRDGASALTQKGCRERPRPPAANEPCVLIDEITKRGGPSRRAGPRGEASKQEDRMTPWENLGTMFPLTIEDLDEIEPALAKMEHKLAPEDLIRIQGAVAVSGPHMRAPPVVILEGRTLADYPCRDNKRPACQGGFLAATADPDARAALWASANNAPLRGVATGPITGFDVLDLDPRHGSDHWLRPLALPGIAMPGTP